MIRLTDRQKAQAVADLLADYKHPLKSFLGNGEAKPSDEDKRHLLIVGKWPDKGLGDKGVGMQKLVAACDQLGIKHGYANPSGSWNTPFNAVVIRLRDVERLNKHLWPQSQK